MLGWDAVGWVRASMRACGRVAFSCALAAHAHKPSRAHAGPHGAHAHMQARARTHTLMAMTKDVEHSPMMVRSSTEPGLPAARYTSCSRYFSTSSPGSSKILLHRYSSTPDCCGYWYRYCTHMRAAGGGGEGLSKGVGCAGAKDGGGWGWGSGEGEGRLCPRRACRCRPPHWCSLQASRASTRTHAPTPPALTVEPLGGEQAQQQVPAHVGGRLLLAAASQQPEVVHPAPRLLPLPCLLLH